MNWLRGLVSRLRKADPGLLGLKTATRAAICIPAVFAFTHQVIGNAQMSLFGAFGSFAILVFADFGGTPRARLSAFLVLAAVGAIFIPLGTLCAKNPWLAGGSMAVVAFAVLFSGLINGYFAAGATAAMLTFILPVSMPVSASVIPDRLAGWGIACLVGISAQLLIWPTRPRDRLGPLIARACRVLADVTESGGSVDEASKAIGQLRDQFFATPYRPTGPTDSAQALTFIVDELDWFKTRLLAPTAEPEVAPLCRAENGEVIDATAAALRASGARFEGSDVVPDLARLDAARDALARSIPERLPEMPQAAAPDAILGALEPSFRLRGMSYSAHQIATNAMAATGGHRPRTRPTLEAVGRLAREHTGARSQWFRDSIRGAAALAIGVFVARETGVQNGFWVVLGTLSVLRSNALATGATVISALAGTAIGIVAGALIVVAIGTDTAVLWALLPVAVLVASYAPRIVSFAAGQAGFTILLLILFNLIVPVGWKVGIVRVQDVAIGFGISSGRGRRVLAPRRRLADAQQRGRGLRQRGRIRRRGGRADRRPHQDGRVATRRPRRRGHRGPPGRRLPPLPGRALGQAPGSGRRRHAGLGRRPSAPHRAVAHRPRPAGRRRGSCRATTASGSPPTRMACTGGTAAWPRRWSTATTRRRRARPTRPGAGTSPCGSGAPPRVAAARRSTAP